MEELKEKVYCSYCEGKRNHNIIYTYKQKCEPDSEYQWHHQYHIVQCKGCDNISFVDQYGDEDTWEYIDGEMVWVDIFTAYPEEPKKLSEEEQFKVTLEIEPKTFRYTPENIKNLYYQIVESFNKNYSILCAAGLRTLIEGICTHLNIKKGYLYDNNGNKIPDKKDNIVRKHETLGGRIFELYDKKLILFPQALILQKVVTFGNLALHEMTSPNYFALMEIIRIVEKVLDDIFELKHHRLLKD